MVDVRKTKIENILDMGMNQIENLVVEVLATAPSTVEDERADAGRIVSYGGALYIGDGAKFTKMQGELQFDTAPTSESANPVTSGGIYDAMQDVKGFQITAEDGYYTLSDGNNVTLTNKTSYWTMSW